MKNELKIGLSQKRNMKNIFLIFSAFLICSTTVHAQIVPQKTEPKLKNIRPEGQQF